MVLNTKTKDMHVKPSNMSLQIVAANSTRGSQQASIKKCVLQRLLSSWWLTETEKPTNTSSIPGNLLYDYSPVYIVDQQIRQCLRGTTRSMDIRPYASARATASCGLFILVLTIRTLNLWELTRVALITLHYPPSLRTMQHVLGGRSQTKVASQQQGAAIHGHPSSTVKYTVASGLFRQIEDKTKVSADERAPSRLPPSSPPPSHYCGALNLWHRDTFIHHGSAMFIASAFVTRVYCLNKLSCAPQRGFFEASADCDELECDVAWLVTALKRVKVRVAYLGLFLPSDSVYQVIVRFVYMIQPLNSD
ncbi:hypothetical protein PCH_Pc16g15410 [Penicillium rubens Wisconsin 54-1255]|uniref:Uncharacterized protein n=1 Tax=Penicillium rubens (strain ATCC 28089 / DSM 1075 / NRRL 1951 / Wisconsin 54-1255) TaxID=500485 RepID=B6HA83_PENRW|nr:hypothetical protein PCH_Pc16g15410 [Penicillium rubens Wisconsin 54-1255]